MRENTAEVIVGAAVLAAAAGFLVYMTQITGSSSSTTRGSYEVLANFRSAEGVSVGTDIRLAGVSVGRVSALSLNPETYRAETVLAIRSGIEIPDDSAVAVAAEGLLGGTFMEIVPGGSFDYLAPGDMFQSTQGAVSITQLLARFVSGGEDGL